MNTLSKTPSNKRWGLPTLYLICTGLFLTIPLLASLIAIIRIPQIEQEEFANLNAIARLNAEQIETWLEERDTDLGVLASRNVLIDRIANAQRNDEAARYESLKGDIETFRRAFDYVSVQLLDAHGNTLVNSSDTGQASTTTDSIKARLPMAAADATIQHSELFLGRDGTPEMGFVAPLYQQTDGEQNLVGFVVSYASFRQYAFPKIERWPTSSQSGETLLVQRDKDNVLFLSTLRQSNTAPFSLRVPLTYTESPAVRAVLDNSAGEIIGKDYRNKPVLATYRPIIGTSWHLIAKIDRAEVLAPLWHIIFWLVPIALLAVFPLMGALLALWRQREKNQDYFLQAEQSKSNQIEQNFFNMPFIGMVIVSPETRHFLKVNEQTCTITGYSREELLNITWQNLTHPDDLKEAYAQVKRIGLGEINAIAFEQRIICKDGSIIFIDVDIKAVRNPEGRLDYLIGTAQDITSRKMQEMAINIANAQLKRSQTELRLQNDNLRHAQDALHSSVERFAAVNRASNNAIINSNSQGIIVDWNPCAEKILGYSAEEIIGRPLGDLIPERYLEAHSAYLQDAYSGNEHNIGELMELTARHKNGREFAINLSLSCWKIAEETFLTSTIRDITERKKTEQTLHMLSEAIRQSPESIAITDVQGNLEFVNEAFLAQTGYTMVEVIGQNPRVLNSGKTPRESYKEMWEMLTCGTPWKGEFCNKRKDGSLYTEFATVAPIKQADGSITHYVAVKEDITEKKRLGEELNNYRFHLEDEVDRRTAQLAEARIQADAANVAKSAFLANMSHEIRTPMNAIVGLTHLLRNSDPTPRQLDRLLKIETSAAHLLELINNILDLSKIEAEKMELEDLDFSLDSVFDSVRSMVTNQAREKRLPIVLDLQDVPRWLRGDAARLRQALLNYAANAVKFTEHGEITLRARLLEENDQGLLLRFEAEDTGIGLSSEKQAGLFKAFQQADASTTRKYGGTGLGLAITMKLAELMGGEVGVVSELKHGSIFWFTARLKRGIGIMPVASVMEAVNYEEELRQHYRGLKILLADDVELNLEVAQLLLHGVGLQVDAAKNGQEAVDKVRTCAYDLILMDVQMPIMNGLDATRAIRQMSGRSQTPIVAMTANAFDEDRTVCLDAGMNDFLTKPVNPETLYACLIKWLSRPETTKVAPSDSATDSEILECPEKILPATPSHETNILIQRLSRISGLEIKAVLTRLRGNEEKLWRLIELFLGEHALAAKNISVALSADNHANVEMLAHALKGSASLIGADEVAKLANALLHSIRQKDDKPVLEQVFAALDERLQVLIKSLQHALNHEEAIAIPLTLDKQRCAEVLNRLELLLENSDMEASTLAEEETALFQATLGEFSKALLSAIAVFNYDHALAELRAARSACLIE